MICTCGHIDDEHESGFIGPCTVEGCDCICFDGDPDDPLSEAVIDEDED